MYVCMRRGAAGKGAGLNAGRSAPESHPAPTAPRHPPSAKSEGRPSQIKYGGALAGRPLWNQDQPVVRRGVLGGLATREIFKNPREIKTCPLQSSQVLFGPRERGTFEVFLPLRPGASRLIRPPPGLIGLRLSRGRAAVARRGRARRTLGSDGLGVYLRKHLLWRGWARCSDRLIAERPTSCTETTLMRGKAPAAQ
ncbi:hypothetical protein GJAV_G00056140 [Gymnothorax javanicus]|nr:hypothetical protein GJAV_G00056140 [Gymnothorax javanicus]